MSLKTFTAIEAAFWSPSATVVGWMPLSKSTWQPLRSDPARMVTVVVPSPASTSCAWARSTSYKWDLSNILQTILAQGWWSSIFFRMVAPSFVINTSPFALAIFNNKQRQMSNTPSYPYHVVPSWFSLHRQQLYNVSTIRIVHGIPLAARMLDLRTSFVFWDSAWISDMATSHTYSWTPKVCKEMVRKLPHIWFLLSCVCTQLVRQYHDRELAGSLPFASSCNWSLPSVVIDQQIEKCKARTHL